MNPQYGTPPSPNPYNNIPYAPYEYISTNPFLQNITFQPPQFSPNSPDSPNIPLFSPNSPNNSPVNNLSPEYISSINQKSFKHIPQDTTIYDPIMMEEENLHEYLKTKDNLVFIFGNNYFPINKETIKIQIKDPLNIVYECITPDVIFIRYLPDGSTEPNENINIKKKYLRLNSLGLPGDFIPLLRITKILLDTHQIYNMVETDKILKTVISDNVLYHQGSYVGASHCQSGQGGKVYDLNKKIIRAYSKKNRKRVLSITKKKRGYISKSKSSKIKSSLLRKKKSSYKKRTHSPTSGMNKKKKTKLI